MLIRSCDVYQELGISLPDWVRRTRGFTVDVGAYDQVRDRAYEVMARRLEASLPESSLVILDAVYGERAKRDAVYAICRSRGAAPTLLLCRCHDPGEVARRFEARRGQETIPEHEASDLCVFHDIARRWEDPLSDRWLDGGAPPAVLFDTLGGALSPLNAGGVAALALLREALVERG